MKEYVIGDGETGQKLHKVIARVLKEAPTGFGYKMLRKKNIVLNGKKAGGNEMLAVGDKVTFYLSDETFAKFAGRRQADHTDQQGDHATCKKREIKMPIVYEDEHILLYDKPVGVLSQKAKESDYSANEQLLSYLRLSGQLTDKALETFRPSICNRLDRNTSGLLICGKTLIGLRTMNRMLADRSLRKYYLSIVLGDVKTGFELKGYLYKEEASNKVTIYPKPHEGADEIHTEAVPLAKKSIRLGDGMVNISLLRIHLITGKPHQIRAHLASIGHPVLGDYKYGDRRINDLLQQKIGIKSQLLHAHCLVFPQMEAPMEKLSDKTFTAPPPETFDRVFGPLKKEY
ncbi:MAG: RluA family pseudouridine synthase [Lachnospiraceae bacterium]|nr:RluA family pseudouridine synthase [Lachnospiraceae bacterium]